MTAIRRQYFLSFAALGSVTPLLTVFLRGEGGFSYLQIGIALAVMGIPTMTSPPLLTLLADRNIDPRRLIATAAGCSAVILAIMFLTTHFVGTLVLFFFYGLASVAMMPLQDGYFFTLEEDRRRRGESKVEYPSIRLWGTIGYIIPSLILYYPLLHGADVRSILPCGVVFCLLSVANSCTLHPVSPRHGIRDSNSPIPSRVALRILLSHKARWLVIGLALAYFGSSNYYTFIGNYLFENVAISKAYIGLIIVIGVVVEALCTLLIPWLQHWIRLKGIIVLGLFCMATRMTLLAFFPTTWIAVLTQLCHGLEVMAILLCPVMFLNRLADDTFRSSIQGVYTMIVPGIAKVFGCLLAGMVGERYGLDHNLLLGATLATCGMLVIAFLFSRIPPPSEADAEAIL